MKDGENGYFWRNWIRGQDEIGFIHRNFLGVFGKMWRLDCKNCYHVNGAKVECLFADLYYYVVRVACWMLRFLRSWLEIFYLNASKQFIQVARPTFPIYSYLELKSCMMFISRIKSEWAWCYLVSLSKYRKIRRIIWIKNVEKHVRDITTEERGIISFVFNLFHVSMRRFVAMS